MRIVVKKIVAVDSALFLLTFGAFMEMIMK
jgi:hypothetical protein